MSWSFNPFTGNLDIVGGGAVVFEGEVETFADLPETVGDPAVGASYLVRSSTGVWLVSRKQAGIWIRRYDTGVRATDWEYGGDYPVNSVNGQTGNVSLTAADVSAAWALAVSSQFISSNTLLSAGRNSRITLSAVNQTVNVDLPYSGNADGDVVTLVASSGLFTGSTLSIRTATGMSGGLPVTYATLATLTAPNQSFTFVSNGTATGWTLRAVDTHTHAASNITSGTFNNARINFAAPDSIGSTTRNTGAFTNLSAAPTSGSALTLTGGTVTASAPVLDATQTWNNAAVTFTGLRVNVTNTASAAASLLADVQVGGSNVFSINRAGALGAGGAAWLAFNSAFGSAANLGGVWSFGNGQVAFNVGSSLGGGSGTVQIGAGASLGWSSNTQPTAANADLRLWRDAADTLALQRTTSPQTFRIYSTFTSTTSFERLNIAAQTGGSFIIGTEKGSGGGTARGLELRTDNVARINISSTGGIGFYGAAASAQPAAVADATDAASTQARLNDLLARLRTIGIIAT